jgi:hypothetical protein
MAKSKSPNAGLIATSSLQLAGELGLYLLGYVSLFGQGGDGGAEEAADHGPRSWTRLSACVVIINALSAIVPSIAQLMAPFVLRKASAVAPGGPYLFGRAFFLLRCCTVLATLTLPHARCRPARIGTNGLARRTGLACARLRFPCECV